MGMTEEPICELEMAINVWAGSLGPSGQAIELVLSMMLDEPLNMPYWVSELSRIRKSAGHNAAFTELADAVGARLSQGNSRDSRGRRLGAPGSAKPRSLVMCSP